jgi:hypothetical protein
MNIFQGLPKIYDFYSYMYKNNWQNVFSLIDGIMDMAQYVISGNGSTEMSFKFGV